MLRPPVLVLVGVGAFLLALVPLMRFYVQDQVVAAPRNFYQTTRLEARDAAYFDTAALQMRTGVTLSARSSVGGDVGAAVDGDLAVWDTSTAVFDVDREMQIEALDYRLAFDRRTAELVNCCGAHVAGDGGVRFSGLGPIFPPADVRKREYQVFDVTTRRPWPARFDGEERIQGLRTYRFVQEIGPTQVAALDSFSGRLLGLGPRSGNVKAERTYAATITSWVDPRTGTPVKHDEMIRATVQTPDGRGRLTALNARLVTVAADQKSLVARADRDAMVIAAVTAYVPVGALSVGILLVLAGAATGLGGAAKALRGRVAAPPPDAAHSGGAEPGGTGTGSAVSDGAVSDRADADGADADDAVSEGGAPESAGPDGSEPTDAGPAALGRRTP
ncbi:DUF3068 domain-containing protein [Actinomadura sp. HBU206391]|uniref:DUF3068 domain-containing protein n=1 Tax=Actinomadura sp. HBU206391 TaxID=2731692 RepID=UPI00165080F3|nr:DUF3068 domain-containing protein [Actinomadura sp. HBU206391]MBC6456830.1 DUF3068 domain-containing protein [Actinomadura sp. HBU206391]